MSYDYDATNYGLDRQAVISELNLSAEEIASLPDIEKFLLPTGYYNPAAMYQELAGFDESEAFFVDFFATTDDERPVHIPEIALALKINAAWDLVVETAMKAAEQGRIDAALATVESGEYDNEHLRVLVEAKLYENVYAGDDNRPVGARPIRRAGDQYTDQAGLEERAPKYRL